MTVGERRYFAGPADGRTEPRVVTVAGDGVARLAGKDAGAAQIRVLPGEGRIMVSLSGRTAVGFVERRDGIWRVELEGRAYRLRVDDERTHELRALTAEMGAGEAAAELRAPMPGLVVRVVVSPGDAVESGAPLVVMEAMKMENELRAENAGVVAAVHVSEGSTVDRDEILVTFELESA